MKQINVTFEDKDYTTILKAKQWHKGNWHDFLLDLVRDYNKKILIVKVKGGKKT